MPFSSQPRKKGVHEGPQGGALKPSCGHSTFTAKCQACTEHRSAMKADAKPEPTKSKVVDLPTEKVMIARLREKIADRLETDKRFGEKASVILSSWLKTKKK